MTYGLDMSAVRYVTDDSGKRIDAVIPVTMFSALTTFWIEARRAETARIEARTPMRAYRGSLQDLPSLSNGHAPDTQDNRQITRNKEPAAGGKFGRRWADLLSNLPAALDQGNDASGAPATLSAGDLSPATESAPSVNELTPRGQRTPQVFFARQFEQAPPVEIIEAVQRGVYFLRAWRDYRKLTRPDVAELFGKTPDTINWHENGYSRPKPETLVRFAEIFDCPLAQITPKAGSDTRPWLTVASGNGATAKAEKPEPRAPDDTDYPDVVLAHIIAGKTPLTAWRLYRHCTIAQLAQQYGCTAKAMQQLEDLPTLGARAITKLCPVLHCTSAQLLRPAGLDIPSAPLRVREASTDATLKRIRKRSDSETRAS